MSSLPVYAERQRILDSLKSHQVVVVESPTGSGKTTQLPIILHEAGYTEDGILGVTQPRRIATVSVCHYIARKFKSPIPGLIGYKMRFIDETLPKTRLKIMTDGTLLQEIKSDPLLRRYSLIIVDEAHERSLVIDFVLGLLRNVLEARPEFKVIVSSATINAQIFSNYFYQAPIITIETRTFPVEISHLPLKDPDNTEMLLDTIAGLVLKLITKKSHTQSSQEGNDILIFLSGEKVIKDCIKRLGSLAYLDELILLPLYGRLGQEEQEKVFIPTPKGKTKVVVATNIAETSLTIEGISTVIDSGLGKLNFYDPRSYTSSLVEIAISQSSCDQRKGRAGRTQPGHCYRLYPAETFSERPLYTEEEIFRTDLAEVVLRMADLGIRDFHSFPFISKPESSGITGAINVLTLLSALTPEHQLTKIGKMMVELPLLCRHSRMIIEAILHYPQVLEEVIIVTAFLSTNSPLLLPQDHETEARAAHLSLKHKWGGDLATYLRLFRLYTRAPNRSSFCRQYYLDEKIMYELENIVDQLQQIVSTIWKVPILSGGSIEDLLRVCARGLIQFICVHVGRGFYRSLTADRIIIHPGSVIFGESPNYLVAGEVVRTSQTFARSVSPLNHAWIEQLEPHLLATLSELGRRKKKSPRASAYRQDTITIANRVFPITREKGKRLSVKLEWRELSDAFASFKGSSPLAPSDRSIRATLLHNKHPLIREAPLETIVKMASQIHPSRDILKAYPKGTFHIENPARRRALFEDFKIIMRVGKERGRHSAKLGFIELRSDKKNHYRFSVNRNHLTALSDSLTTIDALQKGEIYRRLSAKEKDQLNTVYRRLNESFY